MQTLNPKHQIPNPNAFRQSRRICGSEAQALNPPAPSDVNKGLQMLEGVRASIPRTNRLLMISVHTPVTVHIHRATPLKHQNHNILHEVRALPLHALRQWPALASLSQLPLLVYAIQMAPSDVTVVLAAYAEPDSDSFATNISMLDMGWLYLAHITLGRKKDPFYRNKRKPIPPNV